MKNCILIAFFCFFYMEAFAITMLRTDCATKRTDVTPLQEEIFNEMPPLELLTLLSAGSSELLVDVCGREKEPPEQIPCLEDLLSDNSFVFDHKDTSILLHIRDHFDTLRGFIYTYDQEVKKCNEYYHTYNSVGFCVPYTGQKCLDRRATIGFYSASNERCLYQEIRVFLTPEREIKEELYRGACFTE